MPIHRLSERSLLLLLAAVQFTHVMDFMIMMPLGPQLMRELRIGPGYFSALVAAYTISSGIAGLLTAPFLDRFDRKKLLLTAYVGFGLSTLGCGLAGSAPALLSARIVSGVFGGLASTMVMAIAGDIVPPERRSAGMGVIMTAFSAAAALGVPFGLQMAQHFRWGAPFLFLGGMAVVMWSLAFLFLPPLRGHIGQVKSHPVRAFWELLRDQNVGRALFFMAALVMGHFSIIPLLSPFLVGNLGLPEKDLFLVYLIGGVLTVFSAPAIGRLADAFGRLRLLVCVVSVACIVTLVLTNSGPTPVWGVLVLCGLFFVFASGRFVPGQAIMTLAVPASRRGAFMSLSGCARDVASGLASSIGGSIVTTTTSGKLLHFHWLGWLAVATSILSLWLASRVQVNDSGPARIAASPESAAETPAEART